MCKNSPIDEDALLKDMALERGQAKSLQRLSQEGLAAWQSGWGKTTVRWLLAEKEWERRAMAESAKWQRYSALMGILGVVIGAIFGWAIGILLNSG